MQVGLRVVRGRDWKWSNQDGGEGCVGTIVVVGRAGSRASPDETAIVQWDLGGKTNYRCGHNNAYDLYLLDNGPLGVAHNDTSCTCCHEQTVKGILWQCASCHGYSLCSACYHGDEHSLEHQFYRIDTPSSIPILMRSREGSVKIQSKGTFANAIVTRGPDWDWGNQDGGPHQKGLVTDVKGWDNETFRSVVKVTWSNNESNVYRCGHKGKVDVISVSPAPGVCYYKNHLPLVHSSHDQPEPQSSTLPPSPLTSPLSPMSPPTTQFFYPSVPLDQHQEPLPRQQYPIHQQFVKGEKVRILLDIDVLKCLQRDFGWTNKFRCVIGRIGVVHSVSTSRNYGIVVHYKLQDNTSIKLVVNPAALSKVVKLQVNSRVRILSDQSLVKKLQEGHGEWEDNMIQFLGKEGIVRKVYTDGDVKVLVGNTSWTLNPAILFTVNGSTTQQHMSGSASTGSEVEELLHASLDDVIASELVSAAGQGLYSRVKDILTAHPSMVNTIYKGKTALHMSSSQGHADVVNLLLSSGANADIQDDKGNTALLLAASENMLQVAILLQDIANVNIFNKMNETPLSVSVLKGYSDMVQVLIDAGCDVNKQGSLGNTALHDAITNDGQQDIAVRLVNCDRCDLSVVNHQGFNAFHRAALKGRQQVVTAILDKRPDLLNSAKDDGFTALHLSSLNGHAGLVADLVTQSGCEVNIVNDKNQTALLLAVDKRHKDVVKILLEHNANPNIQDDVGDTPLHAAATIHYYRGDSNNSTDADIIRLLVQHGGNTNIVNHDNKTAVDLCHGNEMASWLKRTNSSAVEGTSLPSTSATSPPHDIKTSSVPTATHGVCRICGNPVDCEFVPCGHRAVCFACSGMFKVCIQCKETTESVRKLEVTQEPCSHKEVVCPDGTVLNQDQEKYGNNMDKLAKLQAEVERLEEAQICSICMENKRNRVFLCGHSTCHVCCELLRDCPMCREPIEKKIPFYC